MVNADSVGGGNNGDGSSDGYDLGTRCGVGNGGTLVVVMVVSFLLSDVERF